jgi:hypothetical protein
MANHLLLPLRFTQMVRAYLEEKRAARADSREEERVDTMIEEFRRREAVRNFEQRFREAEKEEQWETWR